MNEKIKVFFAGLGAGIIAILSFISGIVLSRKRDSTSGIGSELESERSGISQLEKLNKRDGEIYQEIRSQKLED